MVTAARAHLDGQAQRQQRRRQTPSTPSVPLASPSRRLPPAAPGTDAWRERAIELAETRHLTGTVRFLGTDGTGRYETYRVPTSRRDGHYDVTYDRVTEQFDGAGTTTMNGPVVAHCAASEHRRPCAHVGAVLHSAAFRYFRGELVLDLPEDEWHARLWESEKFVDDIEQGRGATAGRRAMGTAGEDEAF